MNEDIVDHMRAEYRRLLRLPYNLERHYSQRYMAFLRDVIAAYEERDAEAVQNEYEEAALPDLLLNTYRRGKWLK